jgi:cytochrome P450
MGAAVPLPSAPGPSPMRGFGPSGNMFRFVRDPIAYAGRVFERYGRVAQIVRAPVHIANPGPGWGTGALATARGGGVVLVTGADHNREILTQHERYHMISLVGRLYPTAPEVTARELPLKRTMTGLFHVNGDEHRRHRRLLMPAFHKTRIEAYRDEMVGIVDDLLARWRVGETRDVHADMTEITLRVATKTLFGEDAGDRGLRLARMMQEWLLTMFSPLMMLPHRDLPGLPYRRFLDLARSIDDETLAILRAKRARPTGGADMLSTLLAARDEDGSALDEDDLVGHTGVIFAAGHETSTNALAWTLMLLSQHPAVARDLDDELAGVLRGGAPSVDDLARMPLLDAVVKESMRVLPPVPMHPRIVAEDSELGGHTLPAGSEIFLSIFHMHHDPAVFEEPRAFRPRRWETIKPSVYEYNPFSAGPRMCIGASFATMEIKIVLATLLQRFRVATPDGARVDPRVAITMAPRRGLRMRVRSRGEAPRTPGRVRGRVRALVDLPA